MKGINTENKKPKYSEMLMQLVEQFDEQLPETLSFEDTLEVGIEAWNLANNKSNLGEDLYKKELKAHKYNDVIEKMVVNKLEHFAEYNNIIVDFSTENDILQVKSQTLEDHFNSLLSRMINVKPTKK
ncbi:MAG: hypothetical protein H0X63_05330 [Flavobacteriales bacterium]|nr:hypothetical protein [Flavobacteriales bacterium]